jgi:hypothetical protein
MMISNAAKNRMWDAFVDDCWQQGIDPGDVDFDAWAEGVVDDAIDTALA